MGILTRLFGGPAVACRDAMQESYANHVRDIRQGKLKVTNIDEAHYFGLYGALEGRYWVRGIQVNEAQMYAELAPFCAMKNEHQAIEALTEYVLYQEGRSEARTEWLKGTINSALQSCKEKHWLDMAAMGLLNRVSWCALLNPETMKAIAQADLEPKNTIPQVSTRTIPLSEFPPSSELSSPTEQKNTADLESQVGAPARNDFSTNDSLWEELNENPISQQQKELYEALIALCEDGVDADEMPNGQGEFGMTPSNPIPCKTVFGSTAYLDCLRTLEGAKVVYKRAGSVTSDLFPHPVDAYEILHPNGQKLAALFISPYQKRISGKAPRGFKLERAVPIVKVVPKENYDELYHQARTIFNQAVEKADCHVLRDWCEKDAPDLYFAFKVFQQLASKNYGKAFYPLSILCGGKDISAFLVQENEETARLRLSHKYWGGQVYEIFKNRSQLQYFAQLAFEWCFANQTNVDAELWCDLGEMYSAGHGVEKDDVQAAIWFRRAAEQGHVKAQYLIGYCYENGSGVPKDDNKAAQWYVRAADQGDAEAQEAMADYWFRKAEQGDARAQCGLGSMYRKGLGVEQNGEQAVYWFRKAAEQGNAPGQMILGGMYSEGHGVGQDDEQAVYWLRKAAEQGYALAQCGLGVMYSEGRSVKQNDEQAAFWFRKAAEQGNALGQYELGRRYRKGYGVGQDDEQAVYWLRKAAEQGNPDAQESLRILEIDWKK